jgi:hypothetical protein
MTVVFVGQPEVKVATFGDLSAALGVTFDEVDLAQPVDCCIRVLEGESPETYIHVPGHVGTDKILVVDAGFFCQAKDPGMQLRNWRTNNNWAIVFLVGEQRDLQTMLEWFGQMERKVEILIRNH